MTFWDHLEELRGCIIRILVATLIGSVVAFCCREWVFAFILAPRSAEFITWRWLGQLPATDGMLSSINLINTGIANQFLVHLKVSACVGVVIVMPYIIYVLFGFINPALYSQERAIVRRVVVWGYLLFMLGLTVNYLIVFPCSVLFLGNYQVSNEVINMIDLNSYIDMLMLLSLAIGIMFELPIVCVMLARMGIVNSHILRQYRRHVIVGILIISALITPTGDPFTLLLVATPIYLLYEISVLVVKHFDLAN